MNTELDAAAKQSGDEIIALSAALDEKMEKWSEVSARPYNLESTECVGFATKETEEPSPLNLVVDVQAPADKREATLRLWAIQTVVADGGTEQFNNIQLDFNLDYDKARELTQKAGNATRDDIRTALHDQATQLTRLIVSNEAGDRYDVTASELNEQEAGKVIKTLQAVLLTLKN